MDDDDAPTQRFHIRHVMAGQQNGRAVTTVVFLHKTADAALHGHIQANGRFIEEQHFGPMQQRADKFHLHAFAQRQIADRLLDKILDLEQFNEFIARLFELGSRQPVNGTL